MYSTYNEGKSVVVERFIRTLKNNIFKHMVAVSKKFYFDVWDNIVNKYNNTVHRSIKIKPIDVTSDTYGEYNEDSNKKILNSKLVIMLGWWSFFSQCIDILKFLLVLVMVVTFITGNLKNCLIKKLILLQRLIIVLLHS